MSSSLLVIRHAKAQHDAISGRDFDRALSPKGQLQAQALNRWLIMRLQGGQQPWTAVYSPALRTQQTAQLLLQSLDEVKQISDQRIWNARTQDLLDSVSEHRSTSGGMMLIGHNPGLEQLIYELSGQLQPMATASVLELELDPQSSRARIVDQFRPEID